MVSFRSFTRQPLSTRCWPSHKAQHARIGAGTPLRQKSDFILPGAVLERDTTQRRFVHESLSSREVKSSSYGDDSCADVPLFVATQFFLVMLAKIRCVIPLHCSIRLRCQIFDHTRLLLRKLHILQKRHTQESGRFCCCASARRNEIFRLFLECSSL